MEGRRSLHKSSVTQKPDRLSKKQRVTQPLYNMANVTDGKVVEILRSESPHTNMLESPLNYKGTGHFQHSVGCYFSAKYSQFHKKDVLGAKGFHCPTPC